MYKSKAMVLANRNEPDDLIFEYFEKSDSLSKEHSLEFDYHYTWRYFNLIIDNSNISISVIT